MKPTPWKAPLSVMALVAFLVALPLSPVAAQGEPPTKPALPPPPTLRLSLDEVKERVLADSKLLQLAALNVFDPSNTSGIFVD